MGSTEQTKIGNLIVEGVLRLGQFTTALQPSGTEGALYYNTTEKKTKVYSSSAWGDLGGGWDGVLPNYTTAQRNALSLVNGLIVYNTTDKAVQIYKSGAWANISAKLSLAAVCTLDGDCDSTHCINGYCCDTGCTGNCQRCNVAGLLGTCTDVASDCTGNCDVCTSGNCAASSALCTGNCDVCSGSGTAYSCAASDALCSTCYLCSGSATAYSCSVVAAGTAGYGCTALHYRCDGSGSCTAPAGSTVCIPITYNSCTSNCTASGYRSCQNGCSIVSDCSANCGLSCSYGLPAYGIYSCHCVAWLYN